MSTLAVNAISPASGGTVTITGAALTTPALGTPASGTLTNCTGLPASGVVNTPAGGISATTVQAALNELDTEKFDKAGGTVSGPVTFNGFCQSDDNHAVNNGKRHYFYEPGTSTWMSLHSPSTGVLRISNSGGAICEVNGGNLLVGTSSGNHHTLSKAGANDYATTIINTSATTPYGQRIMLSGVTGGTGSGFLSCQDDVERFRVLGDGNVQNLNNSYGAISDAKLKRDVTDTGPKLSKVLAMRIVNYFLIADPTNTKLLGMIAQELREISPGLVEENPDYEDVIVEPARTDTVTRQRQVVVSEEAVRYEVVEVEGQMRRLPIRTTVDVPQFTEHLLFDEAGQPIMEVVEPETPTTPAVLRQAVHRKPAMEDYTETVDVPAKIERRETGAVTLSIKYSILVPMLVKALQELHADFDQRLAALESWP